MPKSIRIRTEPGVDRNINLKVDQDFDFLEILSLKLRQEDVYTRFCADYGVVVGRVIANGGLGVPNAHISVFVPIDEVDENDPVISTLYPYKTPESKNEDGYRYNLLPYQPEYNGHVATGTFPTEEDVLTRKEVLHVYEKYYRYSVRTNESGDFMIVGVPLGLQNLVMDLDLSNMGEFSLTPNDLLKMNRGIEEQFNGPEFKSSNDLDRLPQIVHEVKQIEVSSFWGQEDFCDVGITRADFDLRELNVEIQPTAVFMGSILSSSEEDYIKKSCRPKNNTGDLCSLVTDVGEILAIRHGLLLDENGEPTLEEYKLESGGLVIDENGVFMVDLPMNLEYVYTNEFGERVTSPDGSVGIPTKGRYRFKIKWQNEGGLQKDIQRANYLVPNIREYGNPDNPNNLNKSYAFSLDWNDYADKDAGIKCEDYFYEFIHNKVYTTALHIDRVKKGFNRSKHLGIKRVNDRECQSENNKFPVNDAQRNFDFLYFIVSFLLKVLYPFFLGLLPVIHVVTVIGNLVFGLLNAIKNSPVGFLVNEMLGLLGIPEIPDLPTIKPIALPVLSYPDCNACSCEDTEGEGPYSTFIQVGSTQGSGVLIDATVKDIYSPLGCESSAYGQSVENFLFSGIDTSLLPNINCSLNDRVLCEALWSPVGPLGFNNFRTTDRTSFAQSLNLMNQRGRYFTGGVSTNGRNIIETHVVNDQFNNTSNSDKFTDLPLILFVNPDSTFQAGDLLTFHDINKINDPNFTGATLNQFGNNRITGTTVSNSSNYITKSITYIDENGVTQTANLELFNDVDGKEYDYKSGVEYFQVITGITANDAYGLNNSQNSLLFTYIFEKFNVYRCDGQDVSVVPYQELINGENYKILFLTRGVDPWTPKQKIKYDLSKIFGYSSFNGAVVAEGEYYLNIPIQPNGGSNSDDWYYDEKTPAAHFIYDTNSDTFNDSTNSFGGLNTYFSSYLFTPDTSAWSAFTTNSPSFYSSVDPQILSIIGPYGTTNGYESDATVGNPILPSGNETNELYFTDNTQERIEGVSFQYTNEVNTLGGPFYDQTVAYTVSPIYAEVTGTNTIGPATPRVNMNTSQNIVFRSDRLPSSDTGEVGFIKKIHEPVLHLNKDFSIYTISETGQSTSQGPDMSSNPADSSGNLEDLSDTIPGQVSGVIDSLSCGGMVPLDCYNGTGGNLTVDDPCDVGLLNWDSKKLLINGCYILVHRPLFSILLDYKLLAEWRNRFLMTFAACRGVIGEMFQNNWVNGTLYMPSFDKKTIFDRNNEVSDYEYCGSKGNQQYSPIYFNTDSNSFFYRSSRYDGVSFIGVNGSGSVGANKYNILFPTTVMELGPKTAFMREIMLSPEYDGYIVDTLKSTTYQDTSNITLLFFLSRLLNSNFLASLSGLGDSSVGSFFSRESSISSILSGADNPFDSRIDGDMAQLYSINSEYGVLPFNEGNYGDSDIFINSDTSLFNFLNGGPLLGIYFSADTANRRVLTNGVTTFGPVTLLGPTNTFGYPNSQEVPFYKWNVEYPPDLVFGSQENTWRTGNNQIRKGVYQGDNFFGPSTQYAQTTNSFYNLGFLTNKDSNGNNIEGKINNISDGIKVGAPFHFYFGLKIGKTAINKFISKYILLD